MTYHLNLNDKAFLGGDYFQFDSVFIKKKSNQIKKKLKKSKPVQTDRFRFGFLEEKPVQTGLAWFFCFGLVFSV